MYSDKENISILTSLMVSHGIRHAVVCPGSRNAPLVHNFTVCPAIECHSVTDERSAGFQAMGMARVLREPVAVCVTSGSALLNVIPAAAEASYQNCGILVISADRPEGAAGQLEGQTMPQAHVMAGFAAMEVSLPQPHDDDSRWLCNRLVNEALMALTSQERPSVHINVPISEPLYSFRRPELPAERKIERIPWEKALEAFSKAKRPMVAMGQLDRIPVPEALLEKAALLAEPLSCPLPLYADQMLLRLGERRDMDPDLVLYLGGNTVSKRLKMFLRRTEALHMVDCTELHDISRRTRFIFNEPPCKVIDSICTLADSPYAARWNAFRTETAAIHGTFVPEYSSMMAVGMFESMASPEDNVFYANSMPVRYASVHARGYRHCNRGLNGIEGCISTAAGASLVSEGRTFIVTGDLAFLYDSNALWQNGLTGNLRIMVLNNGGGAVFSTIPGAGDSPAAASICGRHTATAEGICRQYGAEYLRADNAASLTEGLDALFTSHSKTPAVLEVMTDARADASEYKRYLSLFSK